MSGRAKDRNSLKRKTSNNNNTNNKLSLGNGLNINYVLMGVVGILVVTLIVKECQQKKEQFTEKKDDGLSRWVMFGIIVGILFGLVLLYFVYWSVVSFFKERKKK